MTQATGTMLVAAPFEITREPPPISQTVTVKWDPPTEPFVAGYYVYSGDARGRYTEKVPVGEESTAQIVVGEAPVYVAVTAYTAEGVESVFSEELIVWAAGAEGALPSGGFQTIGSAAR